MRRPKASKPILTIELYGPFHGCASIVARDRNGKQITDPSLILGDGWKRFKREVDAWLKRPDEASTN